MGFIRNLSVRFRLSAAIAVLFTLMLLVSLIGMRVLNRTELWMNVLHQDTLTEVSAALTLSQESSDLATSAPFLFALFAPFQLEKEAQSIRENLQRIEEQSVGDPELALPIARLRLAIDDLTRALLPQTERKAALEAIDREMVRLNNRVRRLANDESLPLEDRQQWADLQQLAINALGAARADALIELGDFSRIYTQRRAQIGDLSPEQQTTLDELDEAMQRGGGLFVLKYNDLAAHLDAENALFRIRQETSRISTYAETKVTSAQERLSQARMDTSRNLELAKKSFFAFILASLLVAVSSAIYVSRYVARNIQEIAGKMRELAAGNLRADLPNKVNSDDEIGQLYAAFDVFRENARNLDRRTGQIRQQNALFSRVFNNIRDGVAVASANGLIEAENANLRKLLRLPPDTTSGPNQMDELIARSRFTRQPTAREVDFEEYANPDGNIVEMRQSPLPSGGTVWLVSETTERKKVEARLEEIRRVEALGKVSGEIAHDFGNILSSISGNLHLMEKADADRARALRQRIGSALDLGVSLTERLLAFARKQHLAPQVTDIGELVEGMADLLEIAVPSTVEIAITVPEAPSLSLVDPGQLESAILNLCVNAGQAIDGAGRIEITVAAGDGTTVTISDNGRGMTPETLRQATEPFYTARADGQGTGLGLSMVDGFVHQSGGDMTITSDTNAAAHGTVITMTFPPVEAVAGPQPMSTGTALVIDDDPAYLASVAQSAEDAGYTVRRAQTLTEGLAMLEAEEFALVISDLNLDSGNSGWDILSAAQVRNPESRLVIMSTREIRGGANGLLAATLKKPFTDADLRRVLM